MVKKINIENISKILSVVFTVFILLSGSTLLLTLDENVKSSDNMSKENILIYILSDRTDSNEWYNGPYFLDTVKDMLEDNDFTVDIKDEITLSIINLQLMINYSQIWILEGDKDGTVEVTQEEADDLYSFYENGGGIWISMEFTGPYKNNYWNEDALMFANEFGVEAGIDVTGSSDGKSISSSHPLFNNVDYIYFDAYVGSLFSTNSDVEMLWEYKSSADGIAVLDSHDEGKGRVIFDSGWMIGYASGIQNEGIPYYDDLNFARNVANWLTDTSSTSINKTQYHPNAKANGPYSGQVNTPVTFDASNSYDTDGTINSYEWDFGDGHTGNGMAPNHSYDKAGEYTVTLVVRDNQSLTDSDKTTVTINEKKSGNNNFNFDNLLPLMAIIIVILLSVIVAVIFIKGRKSK